MPTILTLTKNSEDLISETPNLAMNYLYQSQKRDYVYYNSGYGRYAFFAFFIAAIIIFIIMTCAINVRRMRRGRSPMISSYLAPPSYHQSQVNYEGQINPSLPTYTQNVNPNQDVGYYDKNGNFIPAPATVQINDLNGTNPDPTVANADSSANNHEMESVYIPQQTANRDYSRPPGPPPPRTYNYEDLNVGSSADTNDAPPYESPEPPVQSHYNPKRNV